MTNDTEATHVLSAFAVDHQIILAHEVVDKKFNEIPAAHALIAALGLCGRVFTLDAMHCQKTLQIASSVMLDAKTFASAIRNH